MRLFFASLAIFCLTHLACSAAPVEDDPEPEPEPTVTESELRASIELYVDDCRELCDQNEACIDDTSVYHAGHCHEECDANLSIPEMDVDDLAGIKECIDATAAYSQCVADLQCPGWQSWQDYFGQPTDEEYPCKELTETAHHACHPHMDVLEAAIQ